MNMPLKTVICGTGFGTFYAEAVFRDKKNFKLAGIVARGSERSKNVLNITVFLCMNQPRRFHQILILHV